MKNQFVVNVLKIVTGDFIVKVIGFLSIAFIARLYTPDQLGIFEVIVSVQLVCVTFASLKYELAVVVPVDDEKGFNLLALSILILIISSILLFLVLFIVNQFFSGDRTVKIVSDFYMLLPLMVLFRGIKDNITFWFTRKKRFARASLSDVINKLSEVVFKIGLSFLGVYGLIQGTILGLVCALIVLFYFLIKMDKPIFNKIDFNVMRQSGSEYRKFPLYLLPSNFLRVFAERIPPIFISVVFGIEIVGYYAMSYKLINEPIVVLSKSIGNVFYQEASRLQSRDESIEKLYTQIFEKLIVLSCLPIIFLIIGGKEVIILFLGEQWSDAGIYVQILAPMLFFRFVSMPLMFTLSVIGKQNIEMYFYLSLLLYCVVSLSIGSISGSVIVTLLLFSIGNSILFIFIIYYVTVSTGISMISALKKLLIPIIYLIPFVVTLYLLHAFILHKIVFILLCAFAILGYYIIIFYYYKGKGEAFLF